MKNLKKMKIGETVTANYNLREVVQNYEDLRADQKVLNTVEENFTKLSTAIEDLLQQDLMKLGENPKKLVAAIEELKKLSDKIEFPESDNIENFTDALRDALKHQIQAINSDTSYEQFCNDLYEII